MAKSMRDRMLSASKNPNAGVFDDENYGKIRDYIDTGAIILNAQISSYPRKGIPSGRVIQMAGPESSGKTFICLETILNAQKDGYFIIYYDSEAANDAKSMEARGLDLSRLMYVPVATVEELTTSILNILNDLSKDDRVMIVVDSLGNLSSTKELEDATDGKGTRDMTRAQKLKALFRTVTVKAGVLNVPIMAVNHVYACGTEKMEVLMGDLSTKSLKDIKKGDFVRTTFGTEEVLYKVQYDDATIYEITLENGDILEFTSEHKFLVEKDGEFVWTAVCDLSKNDSIITY